MLGNDVVNTPIFKPSLMFKADDCAWKLIWNKFDEFLDVFTTNEHQLE